MQITVEYIGPATNEARAAVANKVRWVKGFGPAITGRLMKGQTVTTITDEPGAEALLKITDIITKGVPMNNATPVIMDDVLPIAPAPIAPVAPAGDLGAMLGGMVLQSIQPMIAAEVAKGLAVLEKKQPRPILIRRPDADDVVINERVHPVFDKVLKLVSARVNVMLVGPSGCGKTHLFSQVMTALGKEHESISLSDGVTESQITGRLLPTGAGGRFSYVETPFVRLYRTGGGFLFDELDGGNSNTLLCTNQATANGGFSIESRAVSGLDTYVKRHPETVLMATANTHGTGAGAMYVGRNQLDSATLDRWYTVQMDYDKGYEEQIGSPEVLRFVWKLRDVIADNKWRRVASTRMIQKGTDAIQAGLDWATVKADLLAGYTETELQKVKF